MGRTGTVLDHQKIELIEFQHLCNNEVGGIRGNMDEDQKGKKKVGAAVYASIGKDSGKRKTKDEDKERKEWSNDSWNVDGKVKGDGIKCIFRLRAYRTVYNI